MSRPYFMPISEILWQMANLRLPNDDRENTPRYCADDASPYSCDLIRDVLPDGFKNPQHEVCMEFLRSLGLNTGDICAFSEFEIGKERQQARYTWLMFAHQVALEEGK